MISGLLETFQSIADGWSLTDDELTRMLGLGHPSELRSLREELSNELPCEVLDRIDALYRINVGACRLLQRPGQAELWLRKPNHAPLFGGGSALDFMLAGGLNEIRSVCAYLESKVQ